MNIAAILALLLSSVVCSKSDFHAPDGSTLRIIVCPVTAPSASGNEPSDPKAEQRQKEQEKSDAERHST